MRYAMLAVCLFLISCGSEPLKDPNAPFANVTPLPTQGPLEWRVLYETTGLVDVTYTNATGATEQRTNRGLWTFEYTAKLGQQVYLSVQSAGVAASCRILVNGREIQSASVSGQGKIATCSGVVGD